MYNFVFDRRSLVLVLGGLAFAGGLLFFGGVLVGVSWVVPYEARAAALSPPHRPAAVPPEPAAPTSEPPPEELAPPQIADLPADPIDSQDAFTEEAALSPSVAPEMTEAAREPEPAPRADVPVSEESPAPAAISAAPSEFAAEAAVPAGDAAVPAGGFAVQVGAFAVPENSTEAVEELASRGYEPYVESITNSRGRLLHTVRIGRYADREAALRAATDFRHRERMAAIVQPVGTL